MKTLQINIYFLFVAVLLWLSPLFGQTQNPHGTIKIECMTCHTTKSWKVVQSEMKFNHDATGFPLIGEHAKANCMGCHKDMKFSRVPQECIDCHTDVHRGEMGTQCETCHTPAGWDNRQDAIQIHENTRFPLLGVHAMVDCQSCHTSEQRNEFINQPVECQNCHLQDFMQTLNPAHQKAGFDLDCEKCHYPNATSWIKVEYQHPAAFPLTGAHIKTDCNGCHTGGVYAGTPQDCAQCHQSDFATAKNPDHVVFGFPMVCEECHNTSTWVRANFDHFTATGFMLEGQHANIQCISCHVDNQTSGLAKDCYGCHQPDYVAVKDPDHQAGSFSTNCTDCHNQNAWSPADFDHDQTNFPLTGAHKSTDCASCHSSGVFTGLSSDCYSCHNQDFANTTDPNHVANNFDHTCETCHTTTAWQPATFDHNNTSFPLTGAHVQVNCADCHTSGYTNTPADCYSCHESDYNRTNDPNHVANNYDHDCSKCHTTSSWDDENGFNHSTSTTFPLTGAHTTVNCIDCHTNGYTSTPEDCYSCHSSDFTSTTDPNHVANNFDHTCETCHNSTAWQPSTFDHASTSFPLTGAHTAVNCVDCHTSGYTSTPADCYSCHSSDFTSTTDPNHVANNFDHTCETCHNSTAWQPSTFDHASTSFPLTGAHTAVNCVDCHTSGYTSTPADCYSCHSSDFTSTTDPNHVTNNFDHDCSICHSTTAWQPATFDHNSTSFPLTGAHTSVNCADCHTSGYSNTPVDCYSCHSSDYNSTTDPNHASVGFSQECASCHNTTSWGDANWDHDSQYFPIYSGRHQGVWDNCSDCHTTPNDYTAFDCIICHSNAHHLDEGSAGCYRCHPQGRESIIRSPEIVPAPGEGSRI